MWKKPLLIVIIVAALLGLLVRSMLDQARISCEVCMGHGDQVGCRRASGATRDEAISTATDLACASVAPGRTAKMVCTGTRPRKVTCASK